MALEERFDETLFQFPNHFLLCNADSEIIHSDGRSVMANGHPGTA
jgi:hypothetical protein